MKTYDVPGMGNAKITVSGDKLILLVRLPDNAQYGVVHEHVATYTQDTPFFVGLEGFCEYVGDDLRVAAAVLDTGDRLVYLYDHRPGFYPKIIDIPFAEKALVEIAARREEPALYGPDGEMLEWEQGNNFGYVWNLDVDYFSEWGYASVFPLAGEDVDGMNQRHDESRERLREMFGVSMFEIVGPQVAQAAFTPDEERLPSEGRGERPYHDAPRGLG